MLAGLPFCRFQHETGDVSSCALPRCSILRRQPSYIAEIADCATGLQQHEHPLIERVNQHDTLALGVLLYCFSHPRRRALSFSLMPDRAEWNVDVVACSPLARQTVEVIRFRIGTRI